MNSSKKLVITSLFTAFVCAATIYIRIPIPATGGYVHPGDALVILSGLFLGPYCGFFAAGIGSCMADMLGGYIVYAPITFVVKGLVATLCGAIPKIPRWNKNSRYLPTVLGGCVDVIIVCAGYFFFETVLYGASAAALSVIPNAVQGLSGLVIAVFAYPLLRSVPEIRFLMDKSLGQRK